MHLHLVLNVKSQAPETTVSPLTDNEVSPLIDCWQKKKKIAVIWIYSDIYKKKMLVILFFGTFYFFLNENISDVYIA